MRDGRFQYDMRDGSCSMTPQAEYWYSLPNAEKADLLKAIGYTLGNGDDMAIDVSNIGRDEIEKGLIEPADIITELMDGIADRLRSL